MDLPVSPGLIIALIVVVIGILIIAKGLVIVRQSEVMVIERLGSFNRVLESGINIIVPFIEQPRAITMIRYRKMGEEYHAVTSSETRIDRRETVMDFPGQPVVTTDNVTVRINGALYYRSSIPSAPSTRWRTWARRWRCWPRPRCARWWARWSWTSCSSPGPRSTTRSRPPWRSPPPSGG